LNPELCEELKVYLKNRYPESKKEHKDARDKEERQELQEDQIEKEREARQKQCTFCHKINFKSTIIKKCRKNRTLDNYHYDKYRMR